MESDKKSKGDKICALSSEAEHSAFNGRVKISKFLGRTKKRYKHCFI